jgi:hypothetical protein
MTDHKAFLPYGLPPAWLPDWRRREEYTDHGDDAVAWAWEFLRRNPGYHADFKHYAAIPWFWPPSPDNPDGGGHTPKDCARTYGDDAPMLYFFADPPALSQNETVGEYRARTGGEEERLECHLLKKWGIHPISDPAVEDPPIGSAADYLDEGDLVPPFALNCLDSRQVGTPDPEMWRYGWTKNYVEATVRLELDDVFGELRGPDLSSDQYMSFAFDLTLDPKPQTDFVLEKLREIRLSMQDDGLMARPRKSGSSGPQLRKMIDYLRVYDAHWAGDTKQASIAKELFGNSKNERTADSLVSRYLNEARTLVSGGYRVLLK